MEFGQAIENIKKILKAIGTEIDMYPESWTHIYELG